MSTSPSVQLTSSQDRDIFDSLESCEKLTTAREIARLARTLEERIASENTATFATALLALKCGEMIHPFEVLR